MRMFICFVALVCAAHAAPAAVDGKSLGSALLPVGSASQEASSFDRGSQQASSSQAQGSSGYDHGAQAAKTFVNKESSGSKESFAHSADKSYNQGSGSFSHIGAFDKGSNLADVGQHSSSSGIGFPAVSGYASLGSHHQGLHANGFSAGQGAWNYNQGHSSEKSSGNKENFHNKESFGQESSASHAKGSGQHSQAQNSEHAHHDKGHQQSSASQGVIG